MMRLAFSAFRLVDRGGETLARRARSFIDRPQVSRAFRMRSARLESPIWDASATWCSRIAFGAGEASRRSLS